MRKSNLKFVGFIFLLTIPLLLVGIIHLSRIFITPNDQFFELQKGRVPNIDQDDWTLQISGKIHNKISFNYDNFTDLDSKKEVATLECVEGPYGTAEWEGIPLIEILDMADVKNGAYDVVFIAEDYYSDSLNLEEAEADNILLAFKMNGKRLPKEQGFPVRLVTPDHYGYKWVKWIVEIKIVNYDYVGYWEERGWSDNAMRTNFSNWITHAYLFALTFIFGGLSLISGYKFMPQKTEFKKLPNFINLRFHIIFSLLFVAFSMISFLYWIIATFIERGAVFYSIHGMVSLITMIVLVSGGILGHPKLHRTEKGRTLHINISRFAFYLFLGSIIFGMIISVMGGFRLNQVLFP
ncbi:MAG: molybdopterin-dependent oxidoreductase [Candidatus Lokiarchaeota archaeon]|nr:molybdopterin-dependent oxidoreductase [Candidatus Lokiarchaeota archaeon]MBD3343407.1 molybdopterin-dependent oxidoreductase [Candidatus Lokiarchaeota archaeon]